MSGSKELLERLFAYHQEKGYLLVKVCLYSQTGIWFGEEYISVEVIDGWEKSLRESYFYDELMVNTIVKFTSPEKVLAEGKKAMLALTTKVTELIMEGD